MSDDKKVLCPWCNKEMTLEEELPFSGIYAYVCECGAVSPNESGKEKALQAALARPMQKPLTLEETKERVAVYRECINAWDEPIPTLYVCSDNVTVCFDHGFGEQEHLLVENYNRKWRCWATKPTDEERRAAEWDENSGGDNE